MKSGIELIAEERQEQINKHGRSISQDVVYNSGFEKPLTKAASALTVEHGNQLATESMKPSNWDDEIWRKMMSKPYKERLIIAGALIVAELDRINYEQQGAIKTDSKILHLTLEKKWFAMIAAGEKKEEYREIKPYWENRLQNFDIVSRNGFASFKKPIGFKFFDFVSAKNGYQLNCPNIKWQHKGIRIGEGKEQWGAEPGKTYFILEIGELINDTL